MTATTADRGEMAVEGGTYVRPRPELPHNFVDSDLNRACAFCAGKRANRIHDPAEMRRFKERWRG